MIALHLWYSNEYSYYKQNMIIKVYCIAFGAFLVEFSIIWITGTHSRYPMQFIMTTFGAICSNLKDMNCPVYHFIGPIAYMRSNSKVMFCLPSKNALLLWMFRIVRNGHRSRRVDRYCFRIYLFEDIGNFPSNWAV